MEVHIDIYPKITILHDDGKVEKVTLPSNASFLYARLQVDESICTDPVGGLKREGQAALKDLGRFIAGVRDPFWVEAPGFLDGPSWQEAVIEAIVDASGFAATPEVSPGPLDPPIRIP